MVSLEEHALFFLLLNVLEMCNFQQRYVLFNSITLEQIEWLTAGDCIAGMHEVVVTERTRDAIKLASEQNRSLWRVSSTVSVSGFIIIVSFI